MKKNIFHFLTILIGFLFFFDLSASAQGSFDSDLKSPTAKVGFFPAIGYHEIDENGNLSGYGFEIMEEIGIFSGCSFEYVGYDKTWEDMFDMLQNGEIDVLSNVNWSEKREELFLFSDYDIGATSFIVTSRKDDNRFLEKDFSSFNGAKIGFERGDITALYMSDFAKEHNFTYKAFYFDNDTFLNKALDEDNKIDLIASTDYREIADQKIITSFGADYFYIVTRKDDTELMEKINLGLSSIRQYEPGKISELRKKYYKQSELNNSFFSLSERNYIEDNKDNVFAALIGFEMEPFAYRDVNGEACGIIPDYVREISGFSGLNMNVIFSEDYLMLAESDKRFFTDIYVDAIFDYNMARELNARLTIPYMNVHMVDLRLKNQRSSSVLKGCLGSTIKEEYKFFPFDNIYRNVNVAIEDLDNGVISTLRVPSYYAQFLCNESKGKYEYDEVSADESDCLFSFAVYQDADSELTSILSKAIKHVDNSELQRITSDYVGMFSKNQTLLDFYRNNPEYNWIFAAVIIVIVSAFTLMLMMMSSSKKEKELADKSRQEEEEKRKTLEVALNTARRFSDSKTLFLSQMSHDIRTPMNAIMGMATLAQLNIKDKKKVSECLDIIQDSSSHLLGLINDILDVSKVESGNLSFSYSVVNLVDLFNKTVHMHTDRMNKKDIKYRFDSRTVVHKDVYTDPVRLEQVFSNVISNAVKYTDQGGKISITLKELESTLNNRYFYEFKVKDNGIGIDKETLDNIFEPFKRSKDVEFVEGSGLGMAITKSIIDVLGGVIDVKSEVGNGTEVTISLGFSDDSKTSLAEYKSLDNKAAIIISPVSDFGSMITPYLNEANMRVYSFSNPVDADEFINGRKDLSDLAVVIVALLRPFDDELLYLKSLREDLGDYPILVDVSNEEIRKSDLRHIDFVFDGFIPYPPYRNGIIRTIGDGIERQKKLVKPSMEKSGIGKNALIVEDVEINAMFASAIVEMKGFKVDVAVNGEEAVKMLNDSEDGYYSIVLMDIQMPVMNGYEATNEIRSSEREYLKTIPIIAMSANAFEEDVLKCKAAGMNDHIAKPVDIARFSELVDLYVKDKE